MKVRYVSVCVVSVGMAAVVIGMLAGCNVFNSGPKTTPPAELVVWLDPEPGTCAPFWRVRDVNNVADRYVEIGTDGQVQFSTGTVCEGCDVDGATILLDDTPRMHIRFGPGPDDTGERRPFLVSTDGFYIELVGDKATVTFQEENLPFEEDDFLADDLAERASDPIANPAYPG